MEIELPKPARQAAIASIQRYFEENLSGHTSSPIGELPAGLLLNFFLEEIGPAIYNRAVADAQTRMEQRVLDITGELYAHEFQYWSRVDAKRKNRR